jgi:hypothetical protein
MLLLICYGINMLASHSLLVALQKRPPGCGGFFNVRHNTGLQVLVIASVWLH